MQFGNDGVFDGIKEKFPNDQKLVAYVDQAKKRYHKVFIAQAKFYEKIQSALKSSHGELYTYIKEIKNQSAWKGAQDQVHVESGWLILADGKVYRTYVGATGLLSKEQLKQLGFKF